MNEVEPRCLVCAHPRSGDIDEFGYEKKLGATILKIPGQLFRLCARHAAGGHHCREWKLASLLEELWVAEYWQVCRKVTAFLWLLPVEADGSRCVTDGDVPAKSLDGSLDLWASPGHKCRDQESSLLAGPLDDFPDHLPLEAHEDQSQGQRNEEQGSGHRQLEQVAENCQNAEDPQGSTHGQLVLLKARAHQSDSMAAIGGKDDEPHTPKAQGECRIGEAPSPGQRGVRIGYADVQRCHERRGNGQGIAKDKHIAYVARPRWMPYTHWLATGNDDDAFQIRRTRWYQET